MYPRRISAPASVVVVMAGWNRPQNYPDLDPQLPLHPQSGDRLARQHGVRRDWSAPRWDSRKRRKRRRLPPGHRCHVRPEPVPVDSSIKKLRHSTIYTNRYGIQDRLLPWSLAGSREGNDDEAGGWICGRSAPFIQQSSNEPSKVLSLFNIKRFLIRLPKHPR